ncbi:MAG: hypothetical protein ABIL09_03980 [Gemmatimonadota bacterium]
MGCALCREMERMVSRHMQRDPRWASMPDASRAMAIYGAQKLVAENLLAMVDLASPARLLNLLGFGVPPDPDKGPTT